MTVRKSTGKELQGEWCHQLSGYYNVCHEVEERQIPKIEVLWIVTTKSCTLNKLIMWDSIPSSTSFQTQTVLRDWMSDLDCWNTHHQSVKLWKLVANVRFLSCYFIHQSNIRWLYKTKTLSRIIVWATPIFSSLAVSISIAHLSESGNI